VRDNHRFVSIKALAKSAGILKIKLQQLVNNNNNNYYYYYHYYYYHNYYNYILAADGTAVCRTEARLSSHRGSGITTDHTNTTSKFTLPT